MKLHNDIVSNPIYRHMDLNHLLSTEAITVYDYSETSSDIFSSSIVVTPSGIRFDGRIKNSTYRDVNIIRWENEAEKYRYLFKNNNTIGDITSNCKLYGMVINNKANVKDYSVLYTSDYEAQNNLDALPIYVEITPNSNVNLHELYTNPGNTRVLRIVYVLREGSKLNLVRSFSSADNIAGPCNQIIESRIIQHPASQLTVETTYTDQYDYLQDLYFVEAFKYTLTNFKNRYMVENKNSVHVITDVNHIGPGSVSNVNVRSVELDSSKFTFAGNIKVNKKAENVDANLQNKNLLMSDTAIAVTEPKLDISTKEIACSHGCTVSSVKPEELYFLNTKGFDTETAKKLLMESFING